MRWWLKKRARNGLATAAHWSSHLGGSAESSPVVRALTYHRFGDTPQDAFCVTVRDFDDHMAWLARRELAISLAQLEDHVSGRAVVQRDAVLVTIDDGCPSTLTHALPILRRYGIPAVVFLPAGELRENARAVPTNDGPEHPDERLSWDDLTALVDGGMTIGSHGWTHRSLGRLTLADARADLQRSHDELARRLGREVRAFAYPFGTRADYTDATTALLPEIGFTCGFTSQHGAIRRGAEAFALPRIKVEGGESLDMFQRLAQGALDGWRWVDRTLWRLQSAR